MRKYWILLIMLVLPVLIFLFLKMAGRNEYALQMVNPPEVAGCSPSKDAEGYHVVPAFEFINQDGERFESAQLAGKLSLVSFFFTTCPDVCPKMTGELLRVHEAFKANPLVQMLSITVDPEHDSVAVLKQYAQSYQIQTPQWTFLTGDQADILSLAKCGYLLEAQEGIGHSSSAALVDKEGRIRGFYELTDREEVDRLIIEVQVLLHQYGDL